MNLFKKIPKNYLAIAPIFKQEKVKAFTTIVLTLLALSFFGLFAINPTLSTITQLKKQLADNILLDKKLSEKILNLGILQQKYSLLGSDLTLISMALPPKPNAPYFVGQIRAIAKTSNLTINKIQVFQIDLTKEKDVGVNYSGFSFSIDAEANSYEDTQNFLTSILNFDRIITLEMISINNKTEKGNLRLGIRGKAYFKE